MRREKLGEVRMCCRMLRCVWQALGLKRARQSRVRRADTVREGTRAAFPSAVPIMMNHILATTPAGAVGWADLQMLMVQGVLRINASTRT